jgi:hypothetical protein
MFVFGILQNNTTIRIYPWIKEYAKDIVRFILSNCF